MARILHAADLHIGLRRMAYQTPEGDSRLVEAGRVLDALVEAAYEHRPDAVVLAGDTFDTRRPGPAELALVAGAIRRLLAAKTAVIVGTGNHDGTGTIADPGAHTLAWIEALELPGVHVITSPRIFDVAGMTVVGMPYAHKRAFDRLLPGLSPEQRLVEASTRFEQLVRTYLLEARNRAGPVLFVGHLSVAGARLGSERMMHFGWDVTVPAEAFDLADYAALGHIHRQQMLGENLGRWHDDGALVGLQRVGYPGSPIGVDFTEADSPKCFLVVDFGIPEPTFIRVKSPATPLAQIQLTVENGAILGLGWLSVEPGSLVNVIMSSAHPIPSSLEAQVRDQFLHRDGAAKVRITTKVEAAFTERAAVAVPEETDEEALTRWLIAHNHAPHLFIEAARQFLAR